LDWRCHPEAGALRPTKDQGEPRESPALFADEQVARLARIHIQLPNYKITQLSNFNKELHAQE